MTRGSRDSVLLRPDSILGVGVIRPFLAQKGPMAALSALSGLQDDARLIPVIYPASQRRTPPVAWCIALLTRLKKFFIGGSLYDSLLASVWTTQLSLLYL